MTDTTKGAQRRVSDERLLAILASEAYGPMAPATAHDVALDLMSERAAHAETRRALGRMMAIAQDAQQACRESQDIARQAIAERDALKAALAALVEAHYDLPVDVAPGGHTLFHIVANNPALTAAREVSK